MASLLLMGIFMSPILASAQETEPAKRVSVTVTATEKTSSKEIVQLPADNLPKVIRGPRIVRTRKASPTRTTSTAAAKSLEQKNSTTALKPSVSPTKVALKPAAKATTATLKPSAATAQAKTAALKPIAQPTSPAAVKVATLKPQAKPTSATTKPASVTQENVTPKTSTASSLKPNAGSLKPNAGNTTVKPETPVVTANVSKADQNSGNPKVVKATSIQASNSDKQNTISYVWIGVILIIAGVILGLLFGKTAFLVSFVGVIFILLGVFIF